MLDLLTMPLLSQPACQTGQTPIKLLLLKDFFLELEDAAPLAASLFQRYDRLIGD